MKISFMDLKAQLILLVSLMALSHQGFAETGFTFDRSALNETSLLYGTIITIEGTSNSDLYWFKGTHTLPVQTNVTLEPTPNGSGVLTLSGCLHECDIEAERKVQKYLSVPVDVQPSGDIQIRYANLAPLAEFFKNEFYHQSGLGRLPDLTIESVTARDAFWESQNANERPRLLFDTEFKVKPTDPALGGNVKIVVRWVLRTLPATSPQFHITSHSYRTMAVMKTWRTKVQKVLHWDFPSSGPIPLHILHAETDLHRSAVLEAAARWNKIGQELFHMDLIHPIFVAPKEEVRRSIVAGDPRFSIYSFVDEPFGTCIGTAKADQVSGQIFSVVGFCGKSWIVADKSDVGDGHRFYLENFGPGATHAGTQKPNPDYFDDDISIPQYEFNLRYYTNLLTHEFSHLLGFEHNYLGSVFGSGSDRAGRDETPNNQVGAYDKMSLEYAVFGKDPVHPEWSCAPEEFDAKNPQTYNPECSFMDETADPFSFLTGRLVRALEWMTSPGSKSKPAWTWELTRHSFALTQITVALKYGLVSPSVANTFRTFSKVADRPTQQPAIHNYVLSVFKNILCDTRWEMAIAEKSEPEVQDAVKKELLETRKAILAQASKLGYSAQESIELLCQ